MARKTRTYHIAKNDVAFCGETDLKDSGKKPKKGDTGCITCLTKAVGAMIDREEVIDVMAHKLQVILDIATPSEGLIEKIVAL